MGGFSFDTSGSVRLSPTEGDRIRLNTLWSDLSPFEQGYVDALFAEWAERINEARIGARHRLRRVAFRDLHPETLEAIRKDCDDAQRHNGVTDGGEWFLARQRGEWVEEGFPPLTITLSDDGKVRTSTRGGA